jgi:hypothetical protein
MSDKKISQLQSLISPNAAPDDSLPVVDVSAGDTKKMSLYELSQYMVGGGAIVNGAGGLGYGTGSGGAITQLTSRTTGVTINTTNGAITMFSAAGTATAASFTVTNDKIDITDTIILCQRSGTNLYNLMVTAVANGSFRITFRTTGGAATDAPVINFAVIKAVAS